MPIDSRAGGNFRGDSCVQSVPVHAQVWSWSTPPAPPPKTTTIFIFGSKALPAPYRVGGWVVGDCGVQSVPSQVQVLSVLTLPSPPNRTTFFRMGSREATAIDRAPGVFVGWSCV